MYNHAPEDYDCPVCLLIKGKDNPGVYVKVSDVFYKDDFVTAFIGGKWWKHNEGNVVIITNKHYENVYELPQEFGHAIFDASQKIALALKEVYTCDGVSTWQHNEPAGSQDLWHYHLHVIPRYTDDELHLNFNNFRWVTAEERAPFVTKLQEYFAKLDK
jgi:histidine triad (HIT) family protein